MFKYSFIQFSLLIFRYISGVISGIKFTVKCWLNSKSQSTSHLLFRICNTCLGHVDNVKGLYVPSTEGDAHKLGQRGQTSEKADSDFHLLPGFANVQLSLIHQVHLVTGSEHVEVVPRHRLHGTRTLSWRKWRIGRTPLNLCLNRNQMCFEDFRLDFIVTFMTCSFSRCGVKKTYRDFVQCRLMQFVCCYNWTFDVSIV